ncbi:hypothetical protein SUDANB95_05263 [Actinosynnema sp. ALI-1.44]
MGGGEPAAGPGAPPSGPAPTGPGPGFIAAASLHPWAGRIKSESGDAGVVTIRTGLGQGDDVTAVEICEVAWSVHQTEGREVRSVTVLADDDSALAARDGLRAERCEAV